MSSKDKGSREEILLWSCDSIPGLERTVAVLYDNGAVRIVGPDSVVEEMLSAAKNSQVDSSNPYLDRWRRAVAASEPVMFPFPLGIAAIVCSTEALLLLGHDGSICLWDVATYLKSIYYPPAAQPPSESKPENIASVSAVTVSVSSTGVSIIPTAPSERTLHAMAVDAERQRILDEIEHQPQPVAKSPYAESLNRLSAYQITLPGNCTKIGAGQFHYAAVTSDGDLFTWGLNTHGQLGRLPVASTYTPPASVSLPVAVATLACGAVHTIVTLRDGTAFAFGWNRFGQLGVGGFTDIEALPKQIVFPVDQVTNQMHSVIAAAAGGAHSLFLMQHDRVFACGLNQSGQLGCVSTSWVSSLESSLSNRRQQLDIDRDPADIQPASVESASKPASASAYSEFCEAVPKEVLALQGLGISRVSAGMYHSVALRENGQLYSFGKNKQGQLGLGRSSTDSVDETLPAQEKIEARIVGTEWEIDEESVNMPFLVDSFGSPNLVSHAVCGQHSLAIVVASAHSIPQAVQNFIGDCTVLLEQALLASSPVLLECYKNLLSNSMESAISNSEASQTDLVFIINDESGEWSVAAHSFIFKSRLPDLFTSMSVRSDGDSEPVRNSDESDMMDLIDFGALPGELPGAVPPQSTEHEAADQFEPSRPAIADSQPLSLDVDDESSYRHKYRIRVTEPVTVGAMLALMRFVYTGQVEIQVGDARDVVWLGLRFRVPDLVRCGRALLQRARPDIQAALERSKVSASDRPLPAVIRSNSIITNAQLESAVPSQSPIEFTAIPDVRSLEQQFPHLQSNDIERLIAFVDGKLQSSAAAVEQSAVDINALRCPGDGVFSESIRVPAPRELIAASYAYAVTFASNAALNSAADAVHRVMADMVKQKRSQEAVPLDDLAVVDLSQEEEDSFGSIMRESWLRALPVAGNTSIHRASVDFANKQSTALQREWDIWQLKRARLHGAIPPTYLSRSASLSGEADAPRFTAEMRSWSRDKRPFVTQLPLSVKHARATLNLQTEVSVQLGKLLTDKTADVDADVWLCGRDGVKVAVHSAWLSVRSDYLRAFMLRPRESESTQTNPDNRLLVSIPQLNSVELLVHYLYAGEIASPQPETQSSDQPVELRLAALFELLVFADFALLFHLKDTLQRVLHDSITLDTACFCLVAADHYHIAHLRAAAMHFVARHYTRLSWTAAFRLLPLHLRSEVKHHMPDRRVSVQSGLSSCSIS